MKRIQLMLRKMRLTKTEREAINSAWQALSPEQLSLIREAQAAYAADRFFPYPEYCERMKALSETEEKCDINTYLLAVSLMRKLQDYYEAEGLPFEWFLSALADFRIKLHECLSVKGHYGWFLPKWFFRWFTLERIALSRLQFELRPFKHDFRQGDFVLTPTSLAVNVHIPGEGPLDEALCRADYRVAAEYFARHFEGEFIPFMCDSWLLNPHHEEFLDPASRLLPFQRNYSIIQYEEQEEPTFLWRLTLKPYNGDPASLPESNSLCRAYKKHLLSGGKVGTGFGVYLFPKKNLLPGEILRRDPGLVDLLRASRRLYNPDASAWEGKTPAFTLLHFSDVHGNERCVRQAVELAYDCAPLLEDVINTGDSVQAYAGSGFDFYRNIPGTERILNCIGNHDALDNPGFDWNGRISQKEQAKTYIEPFVKSWGKVHYTPGTTYYSKCYPRHGMRLAVLNTMLRGEELEEQSRFLAAELEAALANKEGVIIALHDCPDGPAEDRVVIPCNFSAMKMPVHAPCSEGICRSDMEAVEKFRLAGGDFVCYLAGHTHLDFLTYHKDFPHQIFVVVAAVGPYRGLRHGDMPRFAGERTEPLMNFVSVDREEKLVKLIRAGADRDFLLRSRKTLVFSYETGEILSWS